MVITINFELNDGYIEYNNFDEISDLDNYNDIKSSYLCRGNLSDILDDTPKSKFTCFEMGKPC